MPLGGGEGVGADQGAVLGAEGCGRVGLGVPLPSGERWGGWGFGLGTAFGSGSGPGSGSGSGKGSGQRRGSVPAGRWQEHFQQPLEEESDTVRHVDLLSSGWPCPRAVRAVAGVLADRPWCVSLPRSIPRSYRTALYSRYAGLSGRHLASPSACCGSC
ncbi:hypothetical protein E4099_00780 [Streptomyces palmae]|uniref:Uncharacterized protein n=1 Tax=Streptomyces palmae TaxID=1701085 RepID=A0A4Z0HE61_9ACTN|nr:hypothetical protein E4099_00780 [Streptomyces palmae]